METYCLFCASGQESKLMEKLKRDGYKPLAPQMARWKPVKGKLRRVTCRLLPGYVFFDSETMPNWLGIYSFPSVLKILEYGDGARALRGSDLEFVAWLKRYDGMLEISRVVQAGSKLAFIDGPLKDMAGRVVKVNKNRKQVQVALGDEGSLMRTVWCSIEYVEENADITAD